MKLVIQIPCHNEEATLGRTLRDLPRRFPPFSEVTVLVVDDGSTDRTAHVARAHGARVARLPRRMGLARAFSAGLDAALALGADVVVNTDGDHQYPGFEIPRLVAPVVHGEADVAIGDRGAPVELGRRALGWIGNRMVRLASGLPEVRDASSGFRAYSRRAALRTTILTDFSYTLESLIQAPGLGLRVAWVPIRTNPPLRPPRLYRSRAEYLRRSAATIVRVAPMYRSLRWPAAAGAAAAASGAWFLARHPAPGAGTAVVAAGAIGVGACLAAVGLSAELLRRQRAVLDREMARMRRNRFRPPRSADETGDEERRPLRP